MIQVVFTAGVVKKKINKKEEEDNESITHSTWQLRPKDMPPLRANEEGCRIRPAAPIAHWSDAANMN